MIDHDGSQRRTLKDLIEEKGFTQTSLAKALKIRRQTINEWINERSVPAMPPSVYLRMCKILDVSLEELVEAFEGYPLPSDASVIMESEEEN